MSDHNVAGCFSQEMYFSFKTRVGLFASEMSGG